MEELDTDIEEEIELELKGLYELAFYLGESSLYLFSTFNVRTIQT